MGDTTKGGIQKTKFTPNVAAGARRTTQPTPLCDEDTSKLPANKVRGRGKITSRPPQPKSGLLTPVAVSGPFAHGPTTINTKARTEVRRQTVTFKSNPSIPACEDEEQDGLEQSLVFNSQKEHFPITLGAIHEEVTVKTEGLPNAIMDDVYLKGGDFFTGDKRLFLVKLPACLPPLKAESADIQASNSPPIALLNVPEEEQAMDIDTFRSLESEKSNKGANTNWPMAAEGLYGKFRIHASGRVSLLVNGHEFNAIPSTIHPEMTGIQRVTAIDTDYEQSFDLGPVTEHVVFTPKIEQLITRFSP